MCIIIIRHEQQIVFTFYINCYLNHSCDNCYSLVLNNNTLHDIMTKYKINVYAITQKLDNKLTTIYHNNVYIRPPITTIYY